MNKKEHEFTYVSKGSFVKKSLFQEKPLSCSNKLYRLSKPREKVTSNDLKDLSIRRSGISRRRRTIEFFKKFTKTMYIAKAQIGSNLTYGTILGHQ